MEEFHAKGPFASHITTPVALESIAVFKEQMNALKEQEAVLKKGLTIFKIDQPPSREIAKLEVVSTEFFYSQNIQATMLIVIYVTVYAYGYFKEFIKNTVM